MAKDLKLTAKLDNQVSGEIEKIISSLGKLEKASTSAAQRAETEHARSVQEFIKQEQAREKEAFRVSQSMNKDLEKAKREQARINEAAARNTLQTSRTQAEAAQRIERQAALAEAALVVDRFDRRIAVEKARHAQILTGLKGNHAATEAEVKRHSAVIARIQMDQSNFKNTPFQQMLGDFGKLNQKLSTMAPAVLGMAGQFGIMSKGVNAAAMAMGNFGPVAGLAVGALGALSIALSPVIEKYSQAAEKAKALNAILTPEETNIEKLEKIKAAIEKYDEAVKKSAQAQRDAQAVRSAMPGMSSVPSGVSPEVARAEQDLIKLGVIGKAKIDELRNKVIKKIEDEKAGDSQLLSAQQSAAEARIALEDNEKTRLIALETLRYEQQIKAAKEKDDIIALAATEHKDRLTKIENDFQQKQFDEQLKRDLERDKKNAQDQKTEKEKQKRRNQELDESEAAELMKTRNLAEQKKAIDRQVFQNKVAMLNATSALVSAAFGKNKATFAIEKGIALASVILSTNAAAAAALAPPPIGAGPILGLPLAGSIKALGAINAATIAATAIKGYKDGGYTGMGGADDVAGVVHRGEYVLSQRDLRAMGGVAAVEGARNGGGTVSHRGDVNISIVLPAGSTPEQAKVAGALAADAYQNRLKEHATLTRDVAYYGVKA